MVLPDSSDDTATRRLLQEDSSGVAVEYSTVANDTSAYSAGSDNMVTDDQADFAEIN